MKKDNSTKYTNGFSVMQIDEGGQFTYFCCPNCKPHILKEYKNLKLNVIKDEFYTIEQFKKTNPTIDAPCCSFCQTIFYYSVKKKPMKKSIVKRKRSNNILTKYCIDQRKLFDTCLKYGKKRAETMLLSDDELWELTRAIQQKCRDFLKKEEKRAMKKKKQKKKRY